MQDLFLSLARYLPGDARWDATEAAWTVDYGTLWTVPMEPQAEASALEYYRSLLHAPLWMVYFYASITVVAVGALLAKLVDFSTSAILFDGASLGLLWYLPFQTEDSRTI
jgi:hypothetical protein